MKNQSSIQNQKRPSLSRSERIHYRDQLRNARYTALADAEGFLNICFALESLGSRLNDLSANSLGQYKPGLSELSEKSETISNFSICFPQYFSSFLGLFDLVRNARNDAMHTGVYARHVTLAAINLCIGLEEALMSQDQKIQVSDLMVRSPVTVKKWQPLALARQLMLTHSFSFLPIFIDEKWMLISETALAIYVRKNNKQDLKKSISEAKKEGLKLIEAQTILSTTIIKDLIEDNKDDSIKIWLVVEKDHPECLYGVLSPYELMSY